MKDEDFPLGLMAGFVGGAGVYYLSQVYKTPLYGKPVIQISPTGDCCCGGSAPCGSGTPSPGGPVYLGQDNILFLGLELGIAALGASMNNSTVTGLGIGLFIGNLAMKLKETQCDGHCFGGPPSGA